jgi:hypothetical protein
MVAPLPDDEAPRGLQLDLLSAILRLHTALADVELAPPCLELIPVRDLIVQAIARLKPHLSTATLAWATSRGFLPRPPVDDEEAPRLRRLGGGT